MLSVPRKRDCYDCEIADGTVYPILRKLKSDGLLTTYLQEESGGPPRRYYALTHLGRETCKKDCDNFLTRRKALANMASVSCSGWQRAIPSRKSPLGWARQRKLHRGLIALRPLRSRPARTGVFVLDLVAGVFSVVLLSCIFALAALAVLSTAGCVYCGAFIHQLTRSFARFQHNALAAAGGRTVRPSAAARPSTTRKAARRLYLLSMISLKVFLICLVLDYLAAVLSAGSSAFCYAYGWFGYTDV